MADKVKDEALLQAHWAAENKAARRLELIKLAVNYGNGINEAKQWAAWVEGEDQ